MKKKKLDRVVNRPHHFLLSGSNPASPGRETYRILAHAQEVVGTCKIQIIIDCLTFIQTTSLQELMEKLKMPSDAEFMKTAIADLNNSSVSLEERQRALQELLVLVEPIDNANGNVNHVYVC